MSARPATSRRRAELIRLVVEGGRKVSEVAAEAELHEMTVYKYLHAAGYRSKQVTVWRKIA